MYEIRELDNVFPRLMKPKEAARHLGYKTTGILKKIPVKPIDLSDEFSKRAIRYDKKALDAFLDQMSGISLPEPSAGGANEGAQAAFDAWKLNHAP